LGTGEGDVVAVSADAGDVEVDDEPVSEVADEDEEVEGDVDGLDDGELALSG
jgi:hypothetical protein